MFLNAEGTEEDYETGNLTIQSTVLGGSKSYIQWVQIKIFI